MEHWKDPSADFSTRNSVNVLDRYHLPQPGAMMSDMYHKCGHIPTPLVATREPRYYRPHFGGLWNAYQCLDRRVWIFWREAVDLPTRYTQGRNI